MFKTNENAIAPADMMRPDVRSKRGDRRQRQGTPNLAGAMKLIAPAKNELLALLDEPEVISWRALMRAFQTIYGQLEKALLAEDDCSISRFQILFNLYFEGPMSASKIASKLLVTRGNISMFLRRLQADGLIEEVRLASSQKRPLFGLTKKGVAMFEGLFPRHIGRVRRLMPALPESYLVTLRKIPEGAGRITSKGPK